MTTDTTDRPADPRAAHEAARAELEQFATQSALFAVAVLEHEAQRRKVIEHATAAGVSISEVADRLGHARTTIYRAMRD
jgi:transcriptional regulator of acetoin/glycerol metabolism